jgi:TonB family protein
VGSKKSITEGWEFVHIMKAGGILFKFCASHNEGLELYQPLCQFLTAAHSAYRKKLSLRKEIVILDIVNLINIKVKTGTHYSRKPLAASKTLKMRILKILLVAMILKSLTLNGQTEEIKYYTFYGTETTKEKAEFYKKIKRDSNKIYIEEYKMNDEINMTGEYKSINPIIENGRFEYYNLDGKLRTIGFYENGLLSGKWYFFNENGEIQDSVDYNILKKVKYIDYDSISEESIFPIEYMRPYLVYPERAKRKEISGIVEVEFVVNENGVITNIEVVKSVDIDLDTEAKRSVASLNNYEIEEIVEEPLIRLIRIPIKFILQ